MQLFLRGHILLFTIFPMCVTYMLLHGWMLILNMVIVAQFFLLFLLCDVSENSNP